MKSGEILMLYYARALWMETHPGHQPISLSDIRRTASLGDAVKELKKELFKYETPAEKNLKVKAPEFEDEDSKLKNRRAPSVIFLESAQQYLDTPIHGRDLKLYERIWSELNEKLFRPFGLPPAISKVLFRRFSDSQGRTQNIQTFLRSYLVRKYRSERPGEPLDGVEVLKTSGCRWRDAIRELNEKALGRSLYRIENLQSLDGIENLSLITLPQVEAIYDEITQKFLSGKYENLKEATFSGWRFQSGDRKVYFSLVKLAAHLQVILWRKAFPETPVPKLQDIPIPVRAKIWLKLFRERRILEQHQPPKPFNVAGSAPRMPRRLAVGPN